MAKRHASKPAIFYKLLPKTVTNPQGVGVRQQIETYWRSNAIPAGIPKSNWSETVTNLETQSAGNKGYQNSGALFALQAATAKANNRFVVVLSFLKTPEMTTKVIKPGAAILFPYQGAEQKMEYQNAGEKWVLTKKSFSKFI